MTIFQRWRQTALHNKALVLTGVIVALGTIASTGVLIVQVCITRANNRKTSEQIDKLVGAATIQGAAAASFAASADGINTQTQLAVSQFQRMAKASENSIAASIANSRLDQRAWIGLQIGSAFLKAKLINDGQGIQIDSLVLPIKNTGKTPALNVTGRYIVRFRTWKEQPPDYDVELKKVEELKQRALSGLPPNNTNKYQEFGGGLISGQAIGPGTAIDLSTASFQIGSRKAVRDDGTVLNIYIVGSIDYDDIYKETRRHRTRFCLINEGGNDGDNTTSFYFCDKKNWMD